jgi:hypothetical protein
LSVRALRLREYQSLFRGYQRVCVSERDCVLCVCVCVCVCGWVQIPHRKAFSSFLRATFVTLALKPSRELCAFLLQTAYEPAVFFSLALRCKQCIKRARIAWSTLRSEANYFRKCSLYLCSRGIRVSNRRSCADSACSVQIRRAEGLGGFCVGGDSMLLPEATHVTLLVIACRC